MLGWLQRPVFDGNVKPAKYGNVHEKDLIHLPTLFTPLNEQLLYLIEEATAGLEEAKEKKVSTAEIKEKETTLEAAMKRLTLAEEYLAAITDELTKGELSALRIDKEATRKFGEDYITIKSLHDWALEEYGFYILLPSKSASSVKTTSIPSDQLSTNAEADISKKQNTVKKQILQQQEQAIFDKLEELGYDVKVLPKNEKGKKGVKSEIRTALEDNHLFKGTTTFDKAWQRVRNIIKIRLDKK